MIRYIVLKGMKVESANALSGIIQGFPAITGFCGAAHALQRLLSTDNIIINDVSIGIAVHEYEMPRGIPKPNTIFEGTRNRITEHIMNQAYINLVVSIIIRFDSDDTNQDILQSVRTNIHRIRIAGGIVTAIDGISIQKDMNYIQESLNGSFIISDCSYLLNDAEGKDVLQRILNIVSTDKEIQPLAVGYRALTEPAVLLGQRNNDALHVYGEGIYSLGKFINIKSVKDSDKVFWKYDFCDGIYRTRGITLF